LFQLNTPITIEDGWARPAGPNDIVWGYVCGLVDTIAFKVPVSKLGQPDHVVEFYYQPQSKNRALNDGAAFVKLYAKYKPKQPKKNVKARKGSPEEAK